ncbi:MAG: hypothetical protein J6336_11860 [Kiritimatiellae bacterium]|nr:hypothetical protein [Kiritimatiellia bacterium]
MSETVKVELWSASLLPHTDVGAMEILYRTYYEGAPDAAFRRDLAEKDYAIILRESGCVRGFSTMKVLKIGGMDVLFSGDTVVDAGCRNQTGLAGGFGHMMALLNRTLGSAALYWFLICKGARTYRFLPTFFRRYVPGQIADPDLSDRLRVIAAARYPKAFNPATGILHFEEGKDRLKSDTLRMDPESIRFRTMNPGWREGDELCCLAPLAMENLNRLGWRVIAAVEPEWHLKESHS